MHYDILDPTCFNNTPTTTNTTQTCVPPFNRKIELLFACFIGTLTLGGMVVNVSILVLFFGRRRSLTCTNLLLGNLSASNCIACFAVLPVVMSNLISLPEVVEPGAICDLIAFLRQSWWISNMYTLLFMSYDRKVFISRSLEYERIMTNRKAVVFIIVTWFLTVVLSVIPMAGWTRYVYDHMQYHCTLKLTNDVVFNVMYMFLWFWVPCAATVFCYSSIIWSAKRNIDRFAAIVEASTVCSVKRSNSIYKTGKTSAVVILTLLFAWLPYFVVTLIYEARVADTLDARLQTSDGIAVAMRYGSMVIYLPVFAYPYLFAFRNQKLRLELSMLYSKLYTWRDVRKIQPAPNIDEEEYPENVSRRNSRTESMNLERVSRRGSTEHTFIMVRERGSRPGSLPCLGSGNVGGGGRHSSRLGSLPFTSTSGNAMVPGQAERHSRQGTLHTGLQRTNSNVVLGMYRRESGLASADI